MKLSTRGRYGLRAVVNMVCETSRRQVSLKSIAEKEKIPERYLEQIFYKLRNHGIIESIRGAGGGYRLAKSPDKITVGDVLRALEGSLAPVHCAEGMDKSCINYEKCATKIIWTKINDGINEIIDNMTINDVVKEYGLLNESDKIEGVLYGK